MSKIRKYLNTHGCLNPLATLALVLGLSAVFLLSACNPGVNGMTQISGSGVMQTEHRELPEFTGVEYRGRGTLYVSQGESPSLQILTDHNLIELYGSRVKDGVLHLGLKKGALAIPTRLEMRLVVTDLNALSLKGSGRVLGVGQLRTDDMALSLEGSGDVSLKLQSSQVLVKTDGSGDANLDLKAENIIIKSNGSGRVRLIGNTKEQTASINGSGDYLATDLVCETARVKLSGSGDMRLKVQDQLDAMISGSGNLYYSGKPEVNHYINGTGQLRRLDTI